jgi:hypothetical protein
VSVTVIVKETVELPAPLVAVIVNKVAAIGSSGDPLTTPVDVLMLRPVGRAGLIEKRALSTVFEFVGAGVVSDSPTSRL